MASSSQAPPPGEGSGSGSGGRRVPQCYSCKHYGHYARDCGLYWKEENERADRKRLESEEAGAAQSLKVDQPRARSASPRRRYWEPPRRSPSADRYASRYETPKEVKDPTSELVSMLLAKEAAKELRKKEKEERMKKRQEAIEKEEKQRQREEKRQCEKLENDLRVARIIDTQISKRWGPVRAVQNQEEKQGRKKRKRTLHRKLRPLQPREGTDTEEEIAAINAGTEHMELGSSTSSEDEVSPAPTPLTKTSRKMYGTGRRRGRPHTFPVAPRNIAKEIVPTPGPDARGRFVREQKLMLETLDYKEVKEICKKEHVPYVRKHQAIEDLAERRAAAAFGRMKQAPTPATHASDPISSSTDTASTSSEEEGDSSESEV
ncbi:hypothetical protein CBR_g41415 [Chara braunii]|uniref:CCHC-type domain-containing protein n=1 Tax=Chara braunii TaxID=69332 RepID=A0A388LW12_CHABU|nr:hypothetical protein CBR_g41415 [Chara braunii]|eukprot:GBG86419.1 hypothetical protein CBR_g41415 [Chara braunii]